MPELMPAYLAGALFWLAVWGGLFWRWHGQRPAMLGAGLILAPAGPVSEFWSLQDYWHPQYILEFRWSGFRFGGLEDWLLSFALAGICAGVFERCAVGRGAGPLPPLRAWRFGWLAAWPAAGLLVFAAAAAAGVRSIDCIFLAAGGCAVLMLRRRPALGRLAAGLSVLFALVYQAFYAALFLPVFPGAVEATWKLENTWGLRWGGVPLEELAWAAATMLFAGPFLRCTLLPPGHLPDAASKRALTPPGADPYDSGP